MIIDLKICYKLGFSSIKKSKGKTQKYTLYPKKYHTSDL